MAECDAQIEAMLKHIDGEPPDTPLPPDACKNSHSKNAIRLPHKDLREEMMRVFGVDLTQVPGLCLNIICTILSEVGTSLSAFPSAEAFVAWLKLCPSLRSSGGKKLPAKHKIGQPNLATALRLAAQALHADKSYLGQYYRKMRARFGAGIATKATAHKLARIIYAMITKKTPYDKSHFAKAEERAQARRFSSLQRAAKEIGMILTPDWTKDVAQRLTTATNNTGVS